MRFLKVSVLFAGLAAWLLAACGPTYPNCETDDHCKEHNEFCVNGACKQCSMDSHCNAMDKCQVCGPTHTCITQSGCCHSDLDCPGGKCWKDGGDTGTCGGECRGDGDCEGDMICRGGSCVAKPKPQFINCAKPIYFDFNESVLTKDARAGLGANADCIKNANRQYRIEGHCDERGTEEYNLALGERRANASKKYLINAGVDSAVLSTVSYGEEKPVCYDSNESCWWKNRRSEFTNLE